MQEEFTIVVLVGKVLNKTVMFREISSVSVTRKRLNKMDAILVRKMVLLFFSHFFSVLVKFSATAHMIVRSSFMKNKFSTE